MAEKRDYYEVLGVGKSATDSEIKQAYRKLALQYHPDKWTNASEAEKKAAEAKFIEATEAYDVLRDPEKRKKYDQFGFQAFQGQAGPDFSHGYGDLNDILNDLFGGMFGGFGGFGGGARGGAQGPKVARGKNIQTKVTLTLEEIARGCTKEVTIQRLVACSTCGGRGAKNAADIKTCPACHGSGMIGRTVNSFFGQSTQYTTCNQCGGEGKVISNPCPDCGGTGLVRKPVTVSVNIPAGVENGTILRMAGNGHAARNNGITGDLLIVVQQAESDKYERDGADVQYTCTISAIDAMLGCEVDIPLLDGSTIKHKIDAGCQSGVSYKIRGKGLPNPNGYGRGDLFIKVAVWIPKHFSQSEKDILKSLQQSDSFKVGAQKDKGSFFSWFKEQFR